jgi:hypothetical protein
VGKASSTKKVARVAKAGKGTKVRSSQGQVFYFSLAVIAILGVALVVFARQSGKANRVASPPTLTDHWHVAYGFYTCDHFQAPIQTTVDPIGIHTHGDGLIHIHPFTSEATGSNAKLGKFFNTVGVKMSNTTLELPEGQGTYKEGQDCNGKPANLRVAVWDNVVQGGSPQVYTTDFNNIRFTNSGMGITIAFVPDDVDLSTLKPPAERIALLGNPGDLTTATTLPGGTTATTVAGAATTAAPGAATAPGATAAPTTVAPAATTAAPPTSG